MTETPSYEAARDELIAVVQKLEAGGTTLEESIALWERGEKLATICQGWLDGARARLDGALNPDDAARRTTERDAEGDAGSGGQEG